MKFKIWGKSWKRKNRSSKNIVGCTEEYPQVAPLSLRGISATDSERLMSLLGLEFVEAAFTTLLGRSVKTEELLTRLDLLARGISKQEILEAIQNLKEEEEAAPAFVLPMVSLSRVRSASQSEQSSLLHQASEAAASGRLYNTLWVDMTTAFEWTGGVVGIVRAELELAVGLHKLDPSVRFSMLVDDGDPGFCEIPVGQLQWLLESNNIVDSYLSFFGRHKKFPSNPKQILLHTNAQEGFFYPYNPNDAIISVGWIASKKEGYFEALQVFIPSIKIVYLVYDIIMLLPTTKHFYENGATDLFKRYIRWISEHADFVLYGGETAKLDTEAFLNAEGWPVKPGRAIKFGTDITKSSDENLHASLLCEVGVSDPFILTVGSIEPRKNHDTLYRAYLLVLEEMGERAPQLVIVGKPLWRAEDIVDRMKRDPRIQSKVIFATPSDEQLSALYARCLFTLLPSIYEGWSLTLPESLGQGKFCLCCDNPPLREIGGNLVDYISPFDTQSWSRQIVKYARDLNLLETRNARIKAEWRSLRWIDTARMVHDALHELPPPKQVLSQPNNNTPDAPPTLWMDLTLSFLEWEGVPDNVVRTQLNYAYFIKQIVPNVRFFAYASGIFFEINHSLLKWLFDGASASVSFRHFMNFWGQAESAGVGHRNPFVGTRQHPQLHDAYIAAFPRNSIILFAGRSLESKSHRSAFHAALSLIAPSSGVMTAQLIYDFAPVTMPHLYAELVQRESQLFIDFVSSHCDYVVYGGRTAQLDGIAYQKERGLRSPPSDYIKFGSNLEFLKSSAIDIQPHDQEMIASLGVRGDYIMLVGTIEPRNNHEAIYKAYLQILERGSLKRPLQIVFVGRKGQKLDDFMAVLQSDERVDGKIIVLQPTDDELAALYRNCLFTLLPSLYDGWSMSLSESLSFGKFCLTADVAPLRETAGDLVEYVHPLYTVTWADRIEHYANVPEELAARNSRILAERNVTSWKDSTGMLLGHLYKAYADFRREQPEGKSLS